MSSDIFMSSDPGEQQYKAAGCDSAAKARRFRDERMLGWKELHFDQVIASFWLLSRRAGVEFGGVYSVRCTAR